MAGQYFGHYRIIEKIGTGGMGDVFRAHDERLQRDVALKLIRPASSDNPDHLRRFEQEARAAAALNHPNILAIYDVGFEGATPYIVSELLEGKNLRQRLHEGPIPLREAADYALQIAQGLTAAHERLIVHRDLKPENLFLTNDHRIKILDFGVAKLLPPSEDNRNLDSLTTVTKQGGIIGTVAYMSPEQLRGKPVDHRSDIFSFGAILYELMAGQRAFRGETEVDTMTAVLREEPPEAGLEEADIPPGYRDIVKHCLEKDPENRFQSAKDLVFALQTLTGSSTVRPLPLPQPVPRSTPTLPWTLAAVLAVALSMGACSNTNNGLGADGAMASAATPGSQQDFVVNVGDRVYFETDSTDLTATGQATLDKQAEWLNRYPRYHFSVEGHADERGTREYNFALGARRAETTKNYLASHGVSASRIHTTSYGKERPVAVCDDISCWSQNRRAVTVLSGGNS